MNKQKTKEITTSVINHLNKKGVTKKTWSDNDMFIYCKWYTGDFWHKNKIADRKRIRELKNRR